MVFNSLCEVNCKQQKSNNDYKWHTYTLADSAACSMNFHPRECVFVSSQHFPLSLSLIYSQRLLISHQLSGCNFLISTRINFHRFFKGIFAGIFIPPAATKKSKNKILLPREFLSDCFLSFFSFLLEYQFFLYEAHAWSFYIGGSEEEEEGKIEKNFFE